MGLYICTSKREIGTHTHRHSCIVWFELFMKYQCLRYQLWNVLKGRILQMVAVIINVGSMQKLSEYYTTELVNSHFQLCGGG
jgi:hypothetical protein